jgi:hypothetical protein
MRSTREEAIRIFTEAWEAKRAEIGRGIAPKGTKVGAGIDALAEAGLIDLDAKPVEACGMAYSVIFEGSHELKWFPCGHDRGHDGEHGYEDRTPY